jgi:hypothetical protein
VSTSEHHHLDDVAKALARGTISRSQALKFIGASLAGAGLALIPGAASATPGPHTPPGRPPDKPEHAGYGRGGRFKREPQDDYCGGTFYCFENSDCGGGCTCSGWNPAAGRMFCCSNC